MQNLIVAAIYRLSQVDLKYASAIGYRVFNQRLNLIDIEDWVTSLSSTKMTTLINLIHHNLVKYLDTLEMLARRELGFHGSTAWLDSMPSSSVKFRSNCLTYLIKYLENWRPLVSDITSTLSSERSSVDLDLQLQYLFYQIEPKYYLFRLNASRELAVLNHELSLLGIQVLDSKLQSKVLRDYYAYTESSTDLVVNCSRREVTIVYDLLCQRSLLADSKIDRRIQSLEYHGPLIVIN